MGDGAWWRQYKKRATTVAGSKHVGGGAEGRVAPAPVSGPDPAPPTVSHRFHAWSCHAPPRFAPPPCLCRSDLAVWFHPRRREGGGPAQFRAYWRWSDWRSSKSGPGLIWFFGGEPFPPWNNFYLGFSLRTHLVLSTDLKILSSNSLLHSLF
jgi:hypothetical protein